jgi:hypothetical protein
MNIYIYSLFHSMLTMEYIHNEIKYYIKKLTKIN